jgi:hypothetical protein
MPLRQIGWEPGDHEGNRRRSLGFHQRLEVVRGLFHARGAPALGSRPLAMHGYVTEEQICTASDASLLALPTLGRGVLSHIRTVFPLSAWTLPAWMAEE